MNEDKLNKQLKILKQPTKKQIKRRKKRYSLHPNLCYRIDYNWKQVGCSLDAATLIDMTMKRERDL